MTRESTMEVDQATAGPTSPVFDDFLQTGRTGRRNALPDILSENASVSTAQLPDSMKNLSCSDVSPCSAPSTSGQSNTTQKT